MKAKSALWVVPGMLAIGLGALGSAACGKDGTGGSTSSTTSTMTTSSTTKATTGTTMTSSSSGDPQKQACAGSCAAFVQVASDKGCTAIVQADCENQCAMTYTMYPTCTTQYTDLLNCEASDIPMATCSCDAGGDVTCTGVCDDEFAAMQTCTQQM